jgi:hypothetical protein
MFALTHLLPDEKMDGIWDIFEISLVRQSKKNNEQQDKRRNPAPM